MGVSVWFWVPNIIDYLRIILLVVAFLFPAEKCLYTAAIYCVSEYLDAFDGYFARKLNQTSLFGELLDLSIDRASTAVLAIRIASLQPSLTGLMQFIIGLDIISHFFVMVTTFVQKKKSHKDVSSEKNPLIRLYLFFKLLLF
eukprot:gnl/Carplike_NY0171/6124_a8411_251.p1 GENE.gnl/Carplike_NY0171/6124_a8411_251~~gnl/Carplike_NY0171/6124_a8411_251.p1  ORF type:complete len:142 (-),score=21.56 gnl/Carplike_NY0171/6124_a8411_251:239-664(-)